MKALVLGATGATGKDLVQQLLRDYAFESVDIFVRRQADLQHPKLNVYVVDFETPAIWQHLVTGDVAFSCLGTTLKDAGSKDAQWKVDYDYQYEFARMARANGVEHYVLVSASGANAGSSLFYLKMKGQLEQKIRELTFHTTILFQPGLLERKNTSRAGERAGLKIIKFMNKLGLLKSQTPLPTEILAEAMINSVKKYTGESRILKTKEIFRLAR